MKTERRHSYGVIPLHRGAGGVEALIVLQSRHGESYWSFPKGTPEAGETPLQTAARETKEEVGIVFDDVSETPAFEEHYVFEADGVRYDKQVTYFIGFVADTRFVLQPEEIADARWVPLAEAEKELTFPESRTVAQKLRAYLRV